MAYTTLANLKSHLNIESSFTGDDTYLTGIITVAELSIDDYCNGGMDGYCHDVALPIPNTLNLVLMPATVKHAALLLAAHFYLTRSIVSFAQGVEIPYSFKFLLNPYRTYTIG